MRNGLYGISLVALLPGRLGRRLLDAHLVIDESTAMARAQLSPLLARRAFLATGLSVLVCWNVGTAAGAAFGQAVGDPHRLGLDAMFPAAFLALLVPQLAVARARVIALVGGVLALGLVPLVPAGVPVLVACAAIAAPHLGPRRLRVVEADA